MAQGIVILAYLFVQNKRPVDIIMEPNRHGWAIRQRIDIAMTQRAGVNYNMFL